MSGYSIVYFSSVTENTHKFVQKLGHPENQTVRIPIKKTEEMPVMDVPYVLVVPTYGGGVSMSVGDNKETSRPVPPQVRKFLNIAENANNLKAVIAGGNINFGSDYGKAGDIISRKFGVPYVYRFELMGNEEDVRIVTHGLSEFFARLGEAES